MAYFSVAVLLIAGTNGKVGKQSTKTEYLGDSASCNMLRIGRSDSMLAVE